MEGDAMSMGFFWFVVVVLFALAFVDHWFGAWGLIALAILYGPMYVIGVVKRVGEQRDWWG